MQQLAAGCWFWVQTIVTMGDALDGDDLRLCGG